MRQKVDVIVTYGGGRRRNKTGDNCQSLSFSQSPSIRLALALLRAFRIRAATLLDCRSKLPILRGKRLEFLREVVPDLRRLSNNI